MRQRAAPAQDRVIQYLRDYKSSDEADGNSPTYQEIADEFETTVSTAYTLVLRLIKRKIVKVNKRGKIVLGGKYTPPKGD